MGVEWICGAVSSAAADAAVPGSSSDWAGCSISLSVDVLKTHDGHVRIQAIQTQEGSQDNCD